LNTGLQGALEGIKTLAMGQTKFQSDMTAAIAQLAENGKPVLKEEVPDLSEEDLETMPRKDLIALITGNVMKEVVKANQPLNDAIKHLDNRLGESITKGTVEKLQVEHKDLMEWKAEIGAILTAGRSNDVKDAYRLARLDSPDKAKEMDKKYNPPAQKKDAEGFAGVFKGFAPNSGGKTEKNTSMKASTAAAAAWDEATSKMPGIEQYLST
jgi:hypothetical protein